MPVLRKSSAVALVGLCALLGTLLTSGCGGTAPMNSSAGGEALGKGDSLARQIAQLERDVTRAQDTSDIKRLQRAYGYYLDQMQWDEVAGLFAPDATIEIGLDGVYVGQKRIREYLHALGGRKAGLQPGQLHEHYVLQPVIDVAADGRTAQGRWRAFMMLGQQGASASWGEGPYEVDYVKRDGVWQIAKLHWYQTFVVPYQGGWAKNKDLTNGIYVSRALPPDRPPTERYEVWPGVYIPPFHYKNPVGQPSPPSHADESANTSASADPQAAAARAAIETLRARIERISDIDAVENLVSMYGYYLDKQQWDLLTDLFTADGTMEIAQRGVYVGHAGVRRALELFGPQNIEKDHVHNHIQLQPLITISADGTRAFIRSRALSVLGTFNAVGVWGDGVYENEYVKVNGVWKIHVDHVYTTFFAPYDPGWAFGARPTPKISPKIPPDRPPSVVYESLPEIFNPPYHYKNPVTGGEGGGTASSLALDGAPAPVRSALTKIAAAVTREEDQRAIENLQRAYGFYVDKGLWKDAADLFADNGTLEIGGRGVFAGKARVQQYLTRLAPDGLTRGKLMNHLQLQPVVHVAPDGRTAYGRWHFLAEIGADQKSASWGTGVYENTYVKEAGLWKIASLHAYFRMFTPYADGWAKTATPLTTPEKDFPPDRPPTVSYESYPGTFVAPLHYRNPVTGR